MDSLSSSPTETVELDRAGFVSIENVPSCFAQIGAVGLGDAAPRQVPLEQPWLVEQRIQDEEPAVGVAVKATVLGDRPIGLVHEGNDVVGQRLKKEPRRRAIGRRGRIGRRYLGEGEVHTLCLGPLVVGVDAVPDAHDDQLGHRPTPTAQV